MSTIPRKRYYVGWDVGGWNCDKNQKSRDAIVILNASRRQVGKEWRGNLRTMLAQSASAADWLGELFRLCVTEYPGAGTPVTVAIDTPLGFSREFVKLVTRQGFTEPTETSGDNRYLFRATERHILQVYGKQALSAVKDMIGSQATKGMHALAKFAPMRESLGVWTDGHGLRLIEAYPALAKEASVVQRLHLHGWSRKLSEDVNDASVCALIAWLFENQRESLDPPPGNLPPEEGWIWAPKADAC